MPAAFVAGALRTTDTEVPALPETASRDDRQPLGRSSGEGGRHDCVRTSQLFGTGAVISVDDRSLAGGACNSSVQHLSRVLLHSYDE